METYFSNTDNTLDTFLMETLNAHPSPSMEFSPAPSTTSRCDVGIAIGQQPLSVLKDHPVVTSETNRTENFQEPNTGCS